MRLQLASIAPRPGTGPARQLLEQYLARTEPVAVLLDGRGKPTSSAQLAALLDGHKQSAAQLLVFAGGPADGWSDRARAQAHTLLSLGPMTLPHELARILLAEQLYRACTILAGHPYHSGH